MENNNSSPKKIGGIVLDVLTIGMLFAAFAALFYSAFILQTKTFPIGAMCAITAVGLLLLFFIGDVSCLSSKSKNGTLSVGFLVFSSVQLVALILNLALLLGLMIKLFDVNQMVTRLAYVISVSIVLFGYVASVSYFSTSPEELPESLDAPDEEESDEDECDEEASDEEESDEDECDEEASDEEESDEDERDEEASDEEESDEDERDEEASDEEESDEDERDEETSDEEESVEDRLYEESSDEEDLVKDVSDEAEPVELVDLMDMPETM